MNRLRNAAILLVGREILAGARQDRNALPLARFLRAEGFSVVRVEVLPDDRARLGAALRACREDAVIITGGLGSTRDDLTREALGAAFGLPLLMNSAAEKRLRKKLRGRGLPFTDRMPSFLGFPRTALAVPNPSGLAEGIALRRGRQFFLALPGVPSEVEAMLASTLPRFWRRWAGRGGIGRLHEVRIAGARESEVEDRMLDIPAFRRGEVGILPAAGFVGLLTRDRKIVALLKRRFGTAVFTTTGASMAEVLLEELAAREITLAVAESCTGGVLGKTLTAIPGASRVFTGGVIAYSNEAKRGLLGVPATVLARHGAVSAETAAALARGARKKFHADIALAVTGIAGPSGGTREKPVGTVFLGLAARDGIETVSLRLAGTREQIRVRAAAEALNLLWRHLRKMANP